MEWWLSLVGVFIGGALSIGGSYLGWRWGRSERISERQREELLPVAARFLTATRKAWEEHKAFGNLTKQAHKESDESPTAEISRRVGQHERAKAIIAHDEAINEARLINEELYLLSPDTREAADRLFRAVWLFANKERLHETPTDADEQEYEEARRAFRDAIDDALSSINRKPRSSRAL